MARYNFPDRIGFEVTARDIKLGVRHAPCSCAVARAISRVVRTRKKSVVNTVFVTAGNIYITRSTPQGHNCNSMSYDVPRDICNFIRDFDESRPVQPQRFVIGQNIS